MSVNPGVPSGKKKSMVKRKTTAGEIAGMYLNIRPEDTKDGGVVLRLPTPAKGELLEVYLNLRTEGTKDGGVVVRWAKKKPA